MGVHVGRPAPRCCARPRGRRLPGACGAGLADLGQGGRPGRGRDVQVGWLDGVGRRSAVGRGRGGQTPQAVAGRSRCPPPARSPPPPPPPPPFSAHTPPWPSPAAAAGHPDWTSWLLGARGRPRRGGRQTTTASSCSMRPTRCAAGGRRVLKVAGWGARRGRARRGVVSGQRRARCVLAARAARTPHPLTPGLRGLECQ